MPEMIPDILYNAQHHHPETISLKVFQQRSTWGNSKCRVNTKTPQKRHDCTPLLPVEGSLWINTKLFWVITFMLDWKISVQMEEVYSRMTMAPLVGHERSLTGLMVNENCDSRALAPAVTRFHHNSPVLESCFILIIL